MSFVHRSKRDVFGGQQAAAALAMVISVKGNQNKDRKQLC